MNFDAARAIPLFRAMEETACTGCYFDMNTASTAFRDTQAQSKEGFGSMRDLCLP
jgi:hypothetical protein